MIKHYYPVGLDLAGKPVLVVGGGTIAEGKVDQLLDCEAAITVVSPTASARIAALAADGRLTWHRRPFEPSDVEGAWIAIGAADDRSVNAEVARLTRDAGRLVNAVDDVPNCDFIAMSVIHRGDLQVAISTGGGSPAMARWVREGLETLLPEEYAPLLDLLAEIRLELKAAAAVPTYPAWQRAITPEVLALLGAGRRDEAKAKLLAVLAPPRPRATPSPYPLPEGEERPAERLDGSGATTPRDAERVDDRLSVVNRQDTPPAAPLPLGEGRVRAAHVAPNHARVFLVGAGPGDPGLLTLRAHQLLQEADVIVHDRLVDDRILELANPSAELIDVGKEPGRHSTPQPEINQLLVDLARKHHTVVRLKGGDPFVFGRGGEEALALAQAGVPFEVVPGVSAALAAPAYAGIPVTHRGRASAVTIVTGQGCGDGANVAWDELVRSGATLVVLMGLANLPTICQKLRAAGMPASTPIAAIENGSRPDQRTITGTLGDIARLVESAHLGSPATIVVGDVVGLRDQIGWFDREPATTTSPSPANTTPMEVVPT